MTQTDVNRLTRLLQRVEEAGGYFPDPARRVFERLCARHWRRKHHKKKKE